LPDSVPIREEAPQKPINPYGRSKLMIEQMLHWFDQIHDLRYAALRYFNAAGASGAQGEDHHPETHLIPIILQVALGPRDAIHIFGTDYNTPDGTAIRDYIHVYDLAQAHILALQALDKGSRTYNLGNGTGFSVRQVIDVARQVTNLPIPALETPRRIGDPPRLIASSDKIQQELGWQPQYPHLQEIIAHAYAWHQTHPAGYDKKRVFPFSPAKISTSAHLTTNSTTPMPPRPNSSRTSNSSTITSPTCHTAGISASVLYVVIGNSSLEMIIDLR